MDEWTPISAEETNQKIQDMEYRRKLEEQNRQFEEQGEKLWKEYLDGAPQHEKVRGIVWEVGKEYVTEHPEYLAPGLSQAKRNEAYSEIFKQVEQRIASTRQPSNRGDRGDRLVDLQEMGYIPTDEDRNEALREEMEQSWKRRQSS